MQQVTQNTNWQMEGVDLNRTALEAAANKGCTVYQYNIFDQRPEWKNHFDFLVLFDVIEHIEDVPTFLEAALHHLKPNGYLFINVPALMTLFSRYDEAAGHFRRYDTKSLSKELNTSLLNALDIRFWGFSVLPLLLLRKYSFSAKQNIQEIIEQGFNPPNPFIHWSLKKIAQLETRLLKKPIGGTSLLAIAQKNVGLSV